jgi:hypothetical protein
MADFRTGFNSWFEVIYPIIGVSLTNAVRSLEIELLVGITTGVKSGLRGEIKPAN